VCTLATVKMVMREAVCKWEMRREDNFLNFDNKHNSWVLVLEGRWGVCALAMVGSGQFGSSSKRQPRPTVIPRAPALTVIQTRQVTTTPRALSLICRPVRNVRNLAVIQFGLSDLKTYFLLVLSPQTPRICYGDIYTYCSLDLGRLYL
jgi:hypothetical protein